MRYKLRKRLVGFQIPPYKKRMMLTIWAIGGFLLLSMISFYIVDFRIRPTLKQLAMAKAQQIATQAVGEAIRSNIAGDIEYQDLIKMGLNKEGKVAFIQPNTSEINKISAKATLIVQSRLRKMPREIIRIPVGQVFGSKILAGFGPEIPIKVIPIGIVDSKINDNFEVAGINQVRHRIYLTVTATVKMVVPLVGEEIKIQSDIPLVEAVVMGEVPNVYVGSGGVILPAGPEK